MAGGRGTRLFPHTAILPKPLVPVGGKPVLERLLLHLRRHGVRSVILAVHHLHELIRRHFGDGAALGMDIAYAVEETPLGTCGALGALLDRVADDFIVANGDVLTDLDVTALLAHHRAQGADATIAAARRRHRIDYGVLDIDPAGRLLEYREKPQSDTLVSMGLYVLRREAVRGRVAAGARYDMPELLTDMVAARRRVFTWRADCLWLDIGRPDDYDRAQSLADSAGERP